MRRARPLLLLLAVSAAAGAEEPRVRHVSAVRPSEAAAWEARLTEGLRAGTLALRRSDADPFLPGRTHARYAQILDGIPVEGGELVVQTDGAVAVSVFGSLLEGLDAVPAPRLSADHAVDVVARATGMDLGPDLSPRLLVVPLPGGARATWAVRAFTGDDLVLHFVDATSGAIVHRRSDLKRQSAVGLGTGVLADRKKMSVRAAPPSFASDDVLRPPSLLTFDLRGDVGRAIAFLNRRVALGPADLATDADNDWTDAAVVDAHSYAGWTYDYYFKRFGRRGLDDRNLRIFSIVHPVRRADLALHSSGVVDLFYLNAFYAGEGVIVYGEGLPMPLGGITFDYFAGGLDVVAHELTHGVTDHTSQLVYEGESGALNEAFSDMMATAVEFFFQEGGEGPLRAEYALGEDVIRPGGVRSMADPGLHGDPDHYSRRYTGTQDNGGVHINSGIANQAYFLAIEGGTNRTSGLRVTGVGRASREQVEKVAYRAFTLMLPPRATFAMARAAMVQAARDLYGEGSPPEAAVSQAWTAVGVP